MDDTLDEAATRPADDFETLFASQFGRLARLVRRVVNDTAEAEDLAADVLWKCFRKRPEATNLEGWLSRVAIRAALDSIRRKARRNRYESFWPLGPRVAKPDELLERDRDGQRVREVLAVIKPKFATLLVLRTEGLDYRELAAALGVKPGSVGTLLARAESSFRKEYERRHGPQ
jgi:RNA polymerase sigma-70 factor (ECF subfamily)